MEHYVNFILTGSGQHIGVYGVILQNPFVKAGQNAGRIVGIAVGPVKRYLFLYFQIINGVFQASSALFILIRDAEQLLYIKKPDWRISERRHFIIMHISLQLKYIKRPPGTENKIRSAKGKELFYYFLKGTALFQVPHMQMNQVSRNLMHMVIDRGLYKLIVFLRHHPLAV